ncbi:Nif11-like leader peptide family natural product precursor [Synechococcus sp. BS56D]|uniref:Nif11-like leader peptide family RiPP precursor n=1 Tax=Synechococcus sp. BS56D TaxID=2055944 RepID=UPI00103DD8D1|nr:Nif11-like leader peptide family RiPP precursor [Synechococcus sp. BS56D]TCD57630.1 Nif11-like leader peptide family natural product precursor [Synechococcus sp. BS56D]
MASQDLEAFLNSIDSNPDLQDQLSTLDLQGVLSLARDKGFQVRAADLLRAQAEQILAMSDDDLDLLVEGGIDDLFGMNDFQAYLDRT